MTDFEPFDHDDYAKEDCGCGHRRSGHSLINGECTRTIEVRDWDGLPKPACAPGDEDHPFAWPTNWPKVGDIPIVTKPCPCTGFHDREPSEPDWSDR